MINIMRKEQKANVSDLKRKLCQRSGDKCEGCKLDLDCAVRLTEDLEPQIHHIDGNPRNNEVNNLVLLCPRCHSEIMELLSEKRRKAFAKKVVENLEKSFFSNKNCQC